MAINNKPLGSPADGVAATPGEQVSPKLVNHNTTEERFQEGIFDVAVQVDQTQVDLGYAPMSGETTTVSGGMMTVAARLTAVEAAAAGGATIGGAGAMMSDLEGSLATATIRTGAVGTDEISTGAVTSDEIADGTIMSGDVNAAAGIQRTQLETAIQTHDISVGANTDVTVNLGDTIDVPMFTATLDGVAPAFSTANQVTGTTQATEDFYVLGGDGDWHQVHNSIQTGSLIPASLIDATTSAHPTSGALAMGATFTEVVTFLLTGANRVEGTPAMQYALENGDIINFTDTTPDPDQVYAIVYIGAALNAGVDLVDNADNRARFVQLGNVETYDVINNGGLERSGQNFGIAATIPGARTFSGAVTHATTTTTTGTATFNGDVVANGNVDLGDVAGDNITVNGVVDSNIIPDGNGTRALGSATARWDVFADSLNVTGTMTGDVPGANITDNSIDLTSLDRTRADGNEATTGQIPTINTAGDNVDWMVPPIGVERVTALPTTFTDYPNGTLVSLTQVDGSNVVGTYRSTGSAWSRLGTVGMILSTQDIISVTGQTNYTTTRISPAHFITIDGLVLAEGSSQDYTVDADRLGFTLTAAVSAGRDIVIHNFSDVAAIGTGEVATTALAAGALPSGVTIAGSQVNGAVNSATSATNATSSTFTIGAWTIAEVGGNLQFSHTSGLNTVFFSNGEIRTRDDITAFDSTPGTQ